MPDHDQPTGDRPAAGKESRDADQHEVDELEEAERQDPDAPALGAVDGGTELSDPPEPQEPG